MKTTIPRSTVQCDHCGTWHKPETMRPHNGAGSFCLDCVANDYGLASRLMPELAYVVFEVFDECVPTRKPEAVAIIDWCRATGREAKLDDELRYLRWRAGY